MADGRQRSPTRSRRAVPARRQGGTRHRRLLRARRAVRRDPRHRRRRRRGDGPLGRQAGDDQGARRRPRPAMPRGARRRHVLRRLRTCRAARDGGVRPHRRPGEQRRLGRRSAGAHRAVRAGDVRPDGQHRPDRAVQHHPRGSARHAPRWWRQHHQPVVDLRQRRRPRTARPATSPPRAASTSSPGCWPASGAIAGCASTPWRRTSSSPR